MTASTAPRLTVASSGPAVGAAQLAVRDLVEILGRTQQAISRIAEVLARGSSGGRGRKRRVIEQHCQLRLVSWTAGSAVAGLELGSAAQRDLYNEIGRRSVAALIEGIERAASEEDGTTSPPAFDRKVLAACDALGQTLDHGIEAIRFSTPDPPGRCATYTRASRVRIRRWLTTPVASDDVTLTGRLEQINAHAGLSGRLWQPDGTAWTCVFSDDQADLLADAWRHTVSVMGRIDPGAPRKIVVETVLLEQSLTDEPGALSFWNEVELPALAERQQVGPVARLADLTAGWSGGPLEDDPLHAVLEDRRRRRAAARSTA